MSDYKELVEDIRDTDQANWKRLSLDAAKAIENLEQQVENLKQENSFLKSMQREIAKTQNLILSGKWLQKSCRAKMDGKET